MTVPALLDPGHLAALFGRNWRAHYRSDGHPKQGLDPTTIRQARSRGLCCYRCPLRGAIHAGHAANNHPEVGL